MHAAKPDAAVFILQLYLKFKGDCLNL